jgi:Rha family phage regulatory protein
MVSGKDRNIVSLASINLPESVTQFVSVEKGFPVTSSLLVAEKFGVEHFHLLRTIDGLIAEEELVCVNEVGQSTSGLSSDESFDCVKSTYLNEQRKKQPMYLLTESGFMLVAMASKSEGAKKWRRQFVTAFQKLRSLLLEQANSKIRALTKPQEHVWVPMFNTFDGKVYRMLAPVNGFTEQHRLILRKANALVHAKAVIANTRKWEKEFLEDKVLDLIPSIDVRVDADGVFDEIPVLSDLKMGKMKKLSPEAFKRTEYTLNKVRVKK